MPLTHIQRYEVWTSVGPQHRRLYGAMLAYADATVLRESAGTPNHANRLALARRVLRRFGEEDKAALLDMLARVIQAVGLEALADATDGELTAAVSAEWDASATALAGG